MDYGRLIGRAWAMTWTHHFLWVFGLFAASSVGSCSAGYGTGSGFRWPLAPGERAFLSPDGEPALRRLGFLIAQNLETVALVAGLVLLLGLVFLLVSLVAQGGMARATAELALGQPITPGAAWSTGLRLFWRYLLLWILALLLALLVVLLGAVLFGAGFGLTRSIAGPPLLFVIEGATALLLLVVAFPLFVGLSVAITFAQREIAVGEVGAFAALRMGFRLLWDHLGTTALVWLLNLVLSIAAGVVVVLGVVLLAIPIGGLAVALYAVTDLSAALVVYLVAGGVALLAFGWLIGAIANTFFWNYWTLAYLNLTGRLTDTLEPPAEQPPA